MGLGLGLGLGLGGLVWLVQSDPMMGLVDGDGE
jgi:hypothetical protein